MPQANQTDKNRNRVGITGIIAAVCAVFAVYAVIAIGNGKQESDKNRITATKTVETDAESFSNPKESVLTQEYGEMPLTEEQEYILPNESSQYLTYEDIAGLDKETLRLARNEIYARHGRAFEVANLDLIRSVENGSS